MKNYVDEVDIKNEKKIREILAELPDFSKKYFNSLVDVKTSRTRLAYAYDIQHFFNWLFLNPAFAGVNRQSLPVTVFDELTIEDIQEYTETLRYRSSGDDERKTATSSRARKIIALRAFIHYYYKLQEIQTDLSAYIEIPAIKSSPIITLSPEEIIRYLDAISDTEGLSNFEKAKHARVELRDLAIIYMLVGTGIRVSELVGLNLDDIDFYDAKMVVRRKGGDIDEVYFGNEVDLSLREYINNCRPHLAGNSNEPALFISMHHKRLTVRSVQLLTKKYADRAGINSKNVTPHKFRKTYGTHLYDETGDIMLVAETLHHKSVETTSKHYVKVSENRRRSAAKVASSIFMSDE